VSPFTDSDTAWSLGEQFGINASPRTHRYGPEEPGIELLIPRLKDDPEVEPLSDSRPEIMRHEGVNESCSRDERSQDFRCNVVLVAE